MTKQKQGERKTFYLNRKEVPYILSKEYLSEVPHSESIFIPIPFILNQYPSISSIDHDLSQFNHLKQWITVDEENIECLPIDCYSSIVSQMMLCEMNKETLATNLAELVSKSLMAQAIAEDWQRFS